MILTHDKTDHQIKILGLQVLQKELGVMGLLRFIQQFDRGNGNYTVDRHIWQESYTVARLTEEIMERREEAKIPTKN